MKTYLFKKKNKYKAVRTNGMASKLEAQVFNILKLLEKAGKIKDIQCQDTVHLTLADIRCKIDFSFVRIETGQKEYCEAKGAETERWMIIKKLWEFYGPGELSIWKGSYKKPFLAEVVKVKKEEILEFQS